MLEKFAEYFRRIEMPELLQQRAAQLCTEYRTLISGDVDHLFVDDKYDDQGVRRYDSLFIVAGGIMSELREFISANNINFVKLSRAKWIVVRKHDFDPISGVTTTKSRLEVDVAFAPEVGAAELRATHSNCLYLWEFTRAVLLPILE